MIDNIETQRQYRIQKAIDELDQTKLHLLYFSDDITFRNVWSGPLMLTTKLLNKVLGRPSIDHATYICAFYPARFVGDTIDAHIFEATLQWGVKTTDLADRLLALEGKCYIQTLEKVTFDQQIESIFERQYNGMPYSKESAAYSGIAEVPFLKRLFLKFLHPKQLISEFCSKLVAQMLKKRGVNIISIRGGNPNLITPTDLFLGLGPTTLFYDWNG